MKLIRKLTFFGILIAAITFGALKIMEVTRQFDIQTFIKDSGFEVSKNPKIINIKEYIQDYNTGSDTDIWLVTFWATWCLPCKEELKDFSKLSKKYPSEKMRIIAVGVGEDKESTDKFLKQNKIQPNNILFIPDKNKTISRVYNIEFLPVTLVVNRAGQLITGVMGIRPWNRGDYRVFLEYLFQHQTL